MGKRDIHHHQAALASEATRGWWINRGGRYACRGTSDKNIHHPGLSTSPGWPQKQGPPAGGGYLSFPQASVSMTCWSSIGGSAGTWTSEMPTKSFAWQDGHTKQVLPTLAMLSELREGLEPRWLRMGLSTAYKFPKASHPVISRGGSRPRTPATETQTQTQS